MAPCIHFQRDTTMGTRTETLIEASVDARMDLPKGAGTVASDTSFKVLGAISVSHMLNDMIQSLMLDLSDSQRQL